MNQEWVSRLRCPECGAGFSIADLPAHEIRCKACDAGYPVVHGRPVLLRRDNRLFELRDYIDSPPPARVRRASRLARLIPGPSVNLASRRILGELRRRLESLGSATLLVVGGGRQRAWLDAALGAGGSIRVVYSDIDVGADVDLFCDGHALPFLDESFDAIVTTAVLEHVLYPERVAAEIARVSKKGAWLYSELPFMQQVHEGAYDFTRYTLSGHRRLFNGFSEVDSGMVAGPATALVWSIENFLLAFPSRPLPRRLTKSIARALFSWIKYFDYLLAGRPQAMDGASCTYFLGKRIDGAVDDAEIVAGYVGAKHVRHT